MSAPQAKASESATTGAARRPWLSFGLWLLLSLAATCIWTWLAAVIQRSFAPFLLFPLLLGLSVGTTTAWFLRFCQLRHRPAALAGVVLCAVLTIWGQHYLTYLDYRRAYVAAQQADPRWRLVEGQSGAMSPPGFFQFLSAQAARGRSFSLGKTHASTWPGVVVWLLWGLDGLVLLAAALAVVWRATLPPGRTRAD